MAIRIEDDFMCAEHDGRVFATARYSEHAAADGRGAWIVADHPSRLFTRTQAITAMVLAERCCSPGRQRERRSGHTECSRVLTHGLLIQIQAPQ
jgi:hypothetical protein